MCEHHPAHTVECGYACEFCAGLNQGQDSGAEESASGNSLPAPEGYTLEEGVEMPEIYVQVGTRPMLFSTDPNDTNSDGYHDGDVAVINAMIENNNLSATKDGPANWSFVSWNGSSPKRITALTLQGNSLKNTLNGSGLTELSNLNYPGNQLTVNSATGGKVRLTGYTHSSKFVTLTATPDDIYIFKEWTPSGTTLTNNTANPAKFTLDYVIIITPAFTISDSQVVAAAKTAIEGGTYTVAQADAGTVDALKTALAVKINALDGMSGTGITVTADNITVASFNASPCRSKAGPDLMAGICRMEPLQSLLSRLSRKDRRKERMMLPLWRRPM